MKRAYTEIVYELTDEEWEESGCYILDNEMLSKGYCRIWSERGVMFDDWEVHYIKWEE